MTITDYHFFSFFASSLVNTLVAASHRHLMSWRFVRSTRFNRYCIERHDDIRICICKPLLLLRFCALLHTLIAFLLCPNYPIRLLSGLPLSFPPTCCLLSSNTHIRGTTLSSPLSRVSRFTRRELSSAFAERKCFVSSTIPWPQLRCHSHHRCINLLRRRCSRKCRGVMTPE